MRYASEHNSAAERRHGWIVMILLAVVFVGGSVAYVVLAAGEILA